MPGDNGLTDLLNAVGLANKDLVKNSEAAKQIVADQSQATQDAQAAIDKEADDTGIITKAKALAAQHAQSNTLAAASAMGTNPDDASYVLNTLGTSLRQSALDADSKQAKLEHDLSINFFDHPIDFIKAQINMDKTVALADAAIQHRNSTASSIQQLQASTQTTAATNIALQKTMTDAVMEATLDSGIQDARQKKAALRLQNGGIQMQGLRELGSMTMQQVNNLSSAFSAKNQAEQMKLSEAHLKLAQQSADMQLKEFNQKMADKKASQQDLKDIADTTRAGAAAAGYTNITGMPDSKIVTLLNMKADGFMEFFKSGLKTQSLGTPIVSENAGDAAKLVGANGAPLRPEQGTIKTLLQGIWDHAGSAQGGQQGKYDNTKIDQRTTAAGTFAVNAANKMQANIDPKDGSNIYAAPPLKSIFELPALKNSKWYKDVMEPQMRAGGLQEFNSEQLASLSAEAIKKNQITFQEAADGLQAAHAAAARINNATKNFQGFGLPMQGGFKVKLPTLMGRMNSYDLATPQDAQRLLSTKLKPGNSMEQAVSDNPFRY